MTRRRLLALPGTALFAGVVGVITLVRAADAPLPPAAGAAVDFKRDVYPILKNHCFDCHQGQDATSGYRLDQKADILGETDGKVLAKVGDSANSRLIHLVAGRVPNKRMPADGRPPLTAGQIGILRAWIDQGLKWDEKVLPVERPVSTHWAFQPIKFTAPPSLTQAPASGAGVRTPIDAFIRARQQAVGLQAAPEADRRTLIRRLALDLTGLPPTPAEVTAALSDPAHDWYEKRVEHYLASPHYGERWARHWLDLARYADSEGYESDHPRPYMWRYRDYVLNAFNTDKPYDRFVREQVAGDELLPYSDENLIATGFLASARLSSNEEDKALQRNDLLVDIANATAGTLLGVTFNCCQCHNHKFDPFAARDYYRFQGFFVKGAVNNLALKEPELWSAYEDAKPPEYEAVFDLKKKLFENGRARLIAEAKKTLTSQHLAALDIPADERTPEQEKLAREADLKFQFTPGRIEKNIPDEDKALYAELIKKLASLEKKMPDKPQTFGFYSPVSSPTRVTVLPMKGFYPPPYIPAELAAATPHLLVAGEVRNRGPELDVGWPALFGPTPPEVNARPRTVLADWLTSPANPLTARIWVNRLWHFHFGKGIVATPSDFGTRGARPTHPELLDWLATELIKSGWSTKHIHRLIVGSSTYRQATTTSAANARIDPDNKLLWHWPIRRLESETIRDCALAATGELDRTLAGPGEPEGKSLRRTIYLVQRRSQAPQMQKMFDGPAAANESCPSRHVSTVPLQALFLLNNDYAMQRAKALAARLEAVAGHDREKQIDAVFTLMLARPPDAAERAAARQFFAAQPSNPAAALGPGLLAIGAGLPALGAGLPTPPLAALGPALGAGLLTPPPPLVLFCQAMLSLNEFVYIE